MVENEEFNLEDIELFKVTFNSKKNLTELLDPTFLEELNDEFGNVNCINLILNVASPEESQSPKLLVLNHRNDEEIENKKISAELNTVKISNDKSLKKIIKLLSK